MLGLSTPCSYLHLPTLALRCFMVDTAIASNMGETFDCSARRVTSCMPGKAGRQRLSLGVTQHERVCVQIYILSLSPQAKCV